MAMTEKRMIRLINNLQKMTDNDKHGNNPYLGRVLMRNDALYATDTFIMQRIKVRDLPYMTFEQQEKHWYRVYVDENGRIRFTDEDPAVERINANHGGTVTYDNFERLFEFESTHIGVWVNPAFMKKALEPYNIAQVQALVQTADKNRILLRGYNDHLEIDTVFMGIRR